MPRPHPSLIAALALVLAGPVAAQEADPPTTVVYVYPTSPSTFVPVAELPSFLVMPGAPLPRIGSYVVHAVPLPAIAMRAAAVDCSHFEGVVNVLPPDVFGLDADGDGIGCEPDER